MLLVTLQGGMLDHWLCDIISELFQKKTCKSQDSEYVT